MKKKTVLIIAIALIVVIVAVLIIISIINHRKNTTLFGDTKYPVRFETSGSDVHLTILNKGDKENLWNVEVVDEDRVEVKEVKKTKKSKDEYIVSPKLAGSTDIRFVKKGKILDYEYNLANLVISVGITENNEGTVAAVNRDKSFIVLGERIVFAGDSDYPFVIDTDTDGSQRLLFLNGDADWEVEVPIGDVLYLQETVDDNNRQVKKFKYDEEIAMGDNSDDTASQDAQAQEFEKGLEEFYKKLFGVDDIKDISADAYAKMMEALSAGMSKKSSKAKSFSYEASKETEIYDYASMDATALPDEDIVRTYAITSQALKRTEYIKVVFTTEGEMKLSKGKKEDLFDASDIPSGEAYSEEATTSDKATTEEVKAKEDADSKKDTKAENSKKNK